MRNARNEQRPNVLNVIGAAVSTAVGGWLTYSALLIDHDIPLPPAIDAPQERFSGTETGFLNYYVDENGEGRPLVLIHSINAAGSSYEMRPIFEQYRGKRPVYALDLPGFGFSERADREYSPQLYAQAIIDLLERKVGVPADVIALSLGSEFAARAARMRPELFHSLTLISPSGFTRREKKVASQRASGSSASDAALAFFRFPLWSQGFYDVLATRRSIRYFLKQSFEGTPDEGMIAYDYLTAHQRGARFAPFYFVSGKLFSPHIREDVYEKLSLPVLVLYDRDEFVRFDMLPHTLEHCPNWRAVRIAPTRGLPHFEQLASVVSALDGFWDTLA